MAPTLPTVFEYTVSMLNSIIQNLSYSCSHCRFHKCYLVVTTTFVVACIANSSCQQIKFREKWYWFEQLIPTWVL